eukprot:6163787-Pyramimonas_sp.AAC.1
MWTDDGRLICHQFHAVRAGFWHCLQCLAPFTCKHNVRKDYLTPPGIDALVAAWASPGLTRRLDAPPRGASGSNIISNRLKALSKSSSDALENSNKAEQRQRKWVDNPQIRLRAASAGCTFLNSQPGTIPPWRPDSATAQPPARHEPYF